MNDEIAIRFQNVTKRFRIYHEGRKSVFEHLISFLNKKNNYEENAILDDVSFNIKKGEMFGIIGRNGMGKTTLLRLMANIFRPDNGNITINGKLIPILELGTGFQGELTAVDNIIQYGIILGFTRKEIINRVCNILQFAELERFADTKIKNFSSGMIARLAFSTAIQVEPDILLIDEVLAVGDAEFQKKSYNAFLSLKEKKKTIVYISHDMDTVKKLCNRALFLENGKISSIGTADKVVEDYLNTLTL